MHLRVGLRCAFLFVAVGICTAFTFSPGFAGSAGDDAQAPRQAINSGVKLEQSRKWLDAILHYEKATKLWPDSKELEYGLRRSKIHFAIERRYSDSSFRKTLMPLSQTEALRLFDEVLNLIQGRYVENVSMMSVVAHGTESVHLALADERFVASNVPARYRGNIQGFRDMLHERFWNRPIAYREEARQVVSQVCQLGAQQLGMQPTPIILEYVFGGCNALDDYSGFLTPGRLNDLYGNIEGQFVGLGIEIKSELGKGLLLVNVIPESPAAEGGLLAGEHIVGIDGADCRQMTTDEAASMLQGLEGSRVSIEVEHSPGSPARRLNLARRAVTVKSIPIAKMVDMERGIGFIQMTSFQKSSAQELDQAMHDLRRQGMRALIWDLRGNPGGLLTAAVDVADRFIDSGVLVSTKGRTQDQNWNYSAQRRNTLQIPLAVLIDGDSASASEIIAGAIRDHRRGLLVGRKSYGKWSVQSIHEVTIPTLGFLLAARSYIR
jgi:carboxyl-terminal processing protease